MELKELKPVLIWNLFDRITKVPRPSKKEEKIVDFLLDFAKAHHLHAKKDKALNVIMTKPATPGKEHLQTLILQSHVDMVCEKNNDQVFNFETDAIQTRVEGDWVKANGTTLGADDGIGMAAALALLTATDIEHGPLVALFTTDEETGLTGANALDPSFLQGDILLNLDSEEWGEFCIGCAGGKNTIGTFTYQAENAPAGYFWFEVRISNLKGGHSGSDIHKELGNANRILARYLYELSKECPVVLSKIDGGNLHNAIAREASAVAGVPAASKEAACVLLNVLQAELLNELPAEDRKVQLSIHSAAAPASSIDRTTGNRLISALYALPHGVMGWSFDMPGTVETSTNLASVKMKEDCTIVVTTSQRSSTASSKADVVNKVTSVFRLAGADVRSTEGYPGWKPNPSSPILQVSEQVFRKLFGEKPQVISIHAGLECGLFLEKNPRLDMISCGPTVLGAHSPEERLEIPTVEKWWNFLVELLKNIPAQTHS
ncbi:MAG: aminoacyl-histidine dipeptidase [Dysgonamonadaceae bacterium]|jgi:dipeptidase D|nr:aminoacyl-histidine dipeptidase [Dysgonamonadaceae bacterium]